MAIKFNPLTGKFDLVGITSSTADSTYIRLDGTNSPTTGPITFGDDITLTNTADLRLSNGSLIRAQATPGGIYQAAFFVGNGFIGFGINGFANNIGGRGFNFQNVSTVTSGANQIVRTANGLTLNSPIGLEGRVNNVLIYDVDGNGFNLKKGLNEGTVNDVTTDVTLVKENLNTVVDTSGGDVTVTLEASPVEGQRHNIIHKITGGLLTIDGNGNDVYDNTGASLTKTYGVYFAVSLLFDGSDWLIK